MICITFDNFGEASRLTFPNPSPDHIPSEEWAHYDQIGLTLGHPRILHLLKQLHVSATFFAEGYAAIAHPAELQRWRDLGHEIGLHAWKHELWCDLASEADEDRLMDMSMSAMQKALGSTPIGFRPPGLLINPWTDAVMRRHGIRYISQSLVSTAGEDFQTLGMKARERDSITISGLAHIPTSADLIDGALICPAHGGLFGKLGALEAYDRFFELAAANERETPDRPWVLIVHPFTSGNRAWLGFERFMRRLVAEFGPKAFRLARDIAVPRSKAA